MALASLLVACSQGFSSERDTQEGTSNDLEEPGNVVIDLTVTPPPLQTDDAVEEMQVPDSDGEQWRLLAQRTLDLPEYDSTDDCPVSEKRELGPTTYVGNGPVFAFGVLTLPDQPQSIEHYIEDDGSARLKMSWWVDYQDYSGPILVRGRHLAENHEVRFSRVLRQADNDPSNALRLTPEDADERVDDGFQWRTELIVSAQGCHALQIDGEGFSDVIVFEVSS